MSIVEVAKLAGCSHTTVSRVINQKPGVSDEAAGKVQAAMRRLNYTPPIKRRGPQPKHDRAARTGNVAVLMFGTEANPLVAPVAAAAIHAVEQALGSEGYSMTFSQVRDETRLPAIVTRGDVDGLILHGTAPGVTLADRLKRVPGVWIMSPRSRLGYWGDRVSFDNDAIGRLAADYLIDRGHRRIALLYVDATHLGFSRRAEAFAEAADRAGAACDIVRGEHRPNYRPGDFRAERAYIDHLIDRFAKLPERPGGVFIPRGQTTVMVFEALRSRGIEPGRDVTVLACDNDPTLAGLNPPIATIDVRPDRLGQQAVEQILRRVKKSDSFARADVYVQPTLIDIADSSV